MALAVISLPILRLGLYWSSSQLPKTRVNKPKNISHPMTIIFLPIFCCGELIFDLSFGSLSVRIVIQSIRIQVLFYRVLYQLVVFVF